MTIGECHRATVHERQPLQLYSLSKPTSEVLETFLNLRPDFHRCYVFLVIIRLWSFILLSLNCYRLVSNILLFVKITFFGSLRAFGADKTNFFNIVFYNLS